jgi:hypothetical protein
LIWNGYSPPGPLAVGEPMQLHLPFRNEGGPSRGLTVLVWGPAIDAGLVVPTRARLGQGNDALERTLESRATGPGMLLFTARFLDFAIPPGVSLEEPLRGTAKRKRDQLWFETARVAWIFGTVLARGVADVHIGIVPNSSPEGLVPFVRRLEFTQSR